MTCCRVRLWYRFAKGAMGAMAVLIAIAAASGCAARAKEKPIAMAWPEPPEKPRVVFVRTLGSELDLKGRSAAQTAADFILGRRREAYHLYQPVGLAVTDDGQRLFVSDYSQQVVYVFDFSTKKVRMLGIDEKIDRPVGLALDGDENLYVADQGQHRILVYDRNEKFARVLSPPELARPVGIAIDRKAGLLYVADAPTPRGVPHYVRVYDLEGNLVRNIGDGRGSAPGKLNFPTYVAVGPDGNIYVSETLNSRVSVFDPQGKFLRYYGGGGDMWGEMNKPKGVAFDAFGNLYVVDSAWSVVQIFNARGDVLLFFGGRHRFPGMFQNPTAIAIDPKNRIYVGDTFNFRVNVYDLVNTRPEDSFVSVPAPEGGEARKTGAPVDGAGAIARKP